MDLHDYKDVAENYDRYLEVMYRDFDAHEGLIIPREKHHQIQI